MNSSNQRRADRCLKAMWAGFRSAAKSGGEKPSVVRTLANPHVTPLFVATVEATEEAVVNAMVAAETMTGADGYRVPRLPHDELVRVLTSDGVVKQPAGIDLPAHSDHRTAGRSGLFIGDDAIVGVRFGRD